MNYYHICPGYKKWKMPVRNLVLTAVVACNFRIFYFDQTDKCDIVTQQGDTDSQHKNIPSTMQLGTSVEGNQCLLLQLRQAENHRERQWNDCFTLEN